MQFTRRRVYDELRQASERARRRAAGCLSDLIGCGHRFHGVVSTFGFLSDEFRRELAI